MKTNTIVIVVIIILIVLTIMSIMKLNKVEKDVDKASNNILAGDTSSQEVLRSDVSSSDLASAIRSKLNEQNISELNIKFTE